MINGFTRAQLARRKFCCVTCADNNDVLNGGNHLYSFSPCAVPRRRVSLTARPEESFRYPSAVQDATLGVTSRTIGQ